MRFADTKGAPCIAEKPEVREMGSEVKPASFEAGREAFEHRYAAEVLTHVGQGSRFLGSADALVAIGFVFGAIAAGFLQAVGQDLWHSARKLTKQLFATRRAPGGAETHTVMAVFSYDGLSIVAKLELESDDAAGMGDHFGVDPYTLFWGVVPKLLERLMREWEAGAISHSDVGSVLLEMRGSTMQCEESHHKRMPTLEPFGARLRRHAAGDGQSW